MSCRIFTPPSECPDCGAVLNAASVAAGDHATPHPGDVSVCNECGCALEFNPDLTVSRISEETLKALTRQQINTLADVQRRIRATR